MTEESVAKKAKVEMEGQRSKEHDHTVEKDDSIVVAALYKFANLDDYEEMREPLAAFCKENEIRGTLLLAKEGINGTVSGSRKGIDALLKRLRSDPRLADLDHKESYHETKPFMRMKVRLKKEIVTLGVPEVDPNTNVGTYVPPKEWNKLISDPEVILIDTRNKYEVDIGTFKNAVDPKTDTFREFPEFTDKFLAGEDKSRKIAMFCTGGIRCEKSTSFLKQRGFENVYHLKGGILKYLEEVPKTESLWEGECYVFDQRVAVGHDLKKGEYEMCGGCRHPLTAEDKTHEKFRLGIECGYCAGKRPEEYVKRAEARQRQIEIAKARNQEHLGADYSKPAKASAKSSEQDETYELLVKLLKYL
eukprot:CAMPEP_0203790036 /NCGR_PEP_ID=MMETSP0100_2-20121128/3816_1 /ASSEMBLY_ACC=CAM_ASM_000210 /TAXON_ID=96639 /ORGANISM=" , Strain NY0313808BC1" /LENGTH=360 /DNA_ID=CAMNT_0050693119 /DNA_START=901 /DNA_END=1980 /DNA_ORIENTATION=+